jgi:hypothetical protein
MQNLCRDSLVDSFAACDPNRDRCGRGGSHHRPSAGEHHQLARQLLSPKPQDKVKIELGCSFNLVFERAKFGRMVGARGFEPPTPWSRTRCATRLRYAPNILR